jgi:hypothetical protein
VPRRAVVAATVDLARRDHDEANPMELMFLAGAG